MGGLHRQNQKSYLAPAFDDAMAGSLLLSLLAIACTTIGCGGSAPPPTMDFGLSVSHSSVSTEVGATTLPVTIAVDAQNGFTGTVDIALQGIPQGVTTSPSSSFSVVTGVGQSVTFSVPASATVGTSSITVLATSGTLSHQAQFMLTTEAIVRTFQIGSVLYLESGPPTDISRIGLETMWGGSIVEVSLNGTNFVNRHDTGREAQLDFRDVDVPSWNPTLGGDHYDQGTPTFEYALTSNSLYTKAQPLQWSPEKYGGGPGHPVAGDVLVEQTVTGVTGQPHTFKVHYKVTHLGNDLHANTAQEFPAVYTNQDYNRFVYYGGAAPWTNAALTVTQFPGLPSFSPRLYVPERWGALVNSQNIGLTVYVPSQEPYLIGFAAPNSGPGGPTDSATNYFALMGNLTLGPNLLFEADIYLIAGDYATARQIVYNLHQSVTAPDIFTPFEATDQPRPGTTISGVTPVSGWTFDDQEVVKVEILVDGMNDGIASYGSPRPDVQAVFPSSPLNVGFSYSLDTTKYNNGRHTLNVQVTDTSGNIAVCPNVVVTVSNPAAIAGP